MKSHKFCVFKPGLRSRSWHFAGVGAQIKI